MQFIEVTTTNGKKMIYSIKENTYIDFEDDIKFKTSTGTECTLYKRNALITRLLSDATTTVDAYTEEEKTELLNETNYVYFEDLMGKLPFLGKKYTAIKAKKMVDVVIVY